MPEVGFLEIPAREPERLAGFLRRVFGWEAERRDWSEGSYLTLDGAASKIRLGLVEAVAAGLAAPTPVVHVDPGSLEAWLDRIVAAGGRVVARPRRVDGGGRFARFEDSEGNVWGLWSASEAG